MKRCDEESSSVGELREGIPLCLQKYLSDSKGKIEAQKQGVKIASTIQYGLIQ